MAELTIRIYGDPVLRKKARPFEQSELNAELDSLIEGMAEIMYALSGIGLAANQIGETRRIFIADWDQVTGGSKSAKRKKDPSRRKLRVFLNPEILETGEEDEEGNEGCLSIPEVDADVYRWKRIRVRYRDRDWQEHDEWLEDLPARVFQHELDHLDGILFIDRLDEETRQSLAGALNKVKRKYREAVAALESAPLGKEL